MLDKSHCISMDEASRLSHLRESFVLPEETIYMNGNSLGAMPKGARDRLLRLADHEWSQDLIQSWNKNDWFVLTSFIGSELAKLAGADPDEVIVSDSTSVNLFKLVICALNINKPRKKIITDNNNFPTDIYILQGIVNSLGLELELDVVESNDVLSHVDTETALVVLSQVNYRTSELFNMFEMTQAVQKQGALILWDLSHSCGAMPIQLNKCNVDFAVCCGYKFLNGGPGAPAFLFVAKKWQSKIDQPLTGWMGHRDPFAMSTDYEPATGIKQLLTGTPPIASLVCLAEGVSVFNGLSMDDVLSESEKMGDLFIRLVDELCAGYGLSLVSPKDSKKRGSHVAYQHEYAYAVMQALIKKGVIGDFRVPNVMRFAITPLYLRYQDIWEAVSILKGVLENEDWNKKEYLKMAAVT